jgi:predicted metal-dependent hydrolase
MTKPPRTPAPSTPKDLTIKPRDLEFGRETSPKRWWLGGDPVATAFYNALSATFPQGERFFMDAVRRYRGDVSPALSAQIGAFLSQEAMHTREHVFFNRQVADSGFDMAAMEARTKAIIDFSRTQPPIRQLGATIALEHFTAILAHALLADPRHLAGASEEAKAMWRWHSIEEVEHKAVAFDTFMVAAGRMSGARRWLIRVATMTIASTLLISTIGRNMKGMFAEGGMNRPRTWARVLGFLFFKPGILRQVLGDYFTYFRPGFHPWHVDDRALVASAAQGLRTPEIVASAA